MRGIIIIFYLFLSFHLLGQQVNEYVVEFEYDEQGRLVSITHPTLKNQQEFQDVYLRKQQYSYNALNGHNSVSYISNEPGWESIGGFGDGTVVKSTFYNPAGQINQIELYPNWVPRETPVSTPNVFWNSYDNLDRLTSHGARIGGVNVFEANGYDYTDWNYISNKEVLHRAFATETITKDYDLEYSYDRIGQLESFTINNQNVNYEYDSRSNLTERSSSVTDQDLFLPEIQARSFNSENQPSDTSYHFSAEGKLLEDSSFIYTYNSQEQIKTLVGKNSDANWVIASYLYDGNGERVREIYDNKVVYSIRGILNEVLSQEIYYGFNRVSNIDYVYHNGKQFATFYVWDDGSVSDELNDFVNYRDNLGNVLFSIEKNGNYPYSPNLGPRLTYYLHSPYGVEMLQNRSEIGAGQEIPKFEFNNHEKDIVSGLDYMHARFYSPQKGRFLKPDPGFDLDYSMPSSFNLYSYTWNNPVNFFDPNGESATSVLITPTGHVMTEKYIASVLRLTDINDIGVLVTLLTRGGNAINIGGDEATTEDILWAAGGFFVPFVSGSYLKTLLRTGGKPAVNAVQEGVEFGLKGAVKGGKTILEGAVKSNYGRFFKKIPANSKSSASFKQLKDGNFLFEANSPGKVPGSRALYQKWVNPQGETFKMTKTTFGLDGKIIHVKSKF